MHKSLNNIFDFILLKLAKIYVETKHKLVVSDLGQLIQHFNKSNNFDQLKLNLYPYLITMGNGNREKLLEFFDEEFFYTNMGIFHRGFFAISSSAKTDHLHFSFSSTKMEIHDDILKGEFNDTFNESLLLNQNFNIALLETLTSDENADVLICIDKSIESIQKQYPEYFVIGSHQDLLSLNRINTGFINLENSIKRFKIPFEERLRLEKDFNDRIKYERSSLETT